MKVFYSDKAKRFLKGCRKDIASRIYHKVRELKNNPYPSKVKRIEGYKEKLFRIRIGDYRVLYEVDNENEIIGVIKIDKRGRVY